MKRIFLMLCGMLQGLAFGTQTTRVVASYVPETFQEKVHRLEQQMYDPATSPALRAQTWVVLGETYLKAGKFTEAGIFLGLAAGQTVNQFQQAEALYFLGRMYVRGQGVAKNYVRARYYFELAANQNMNAMARIMAEADLGIGYFYGLGVQQDMGKARSYFERAFALAPQGSHVQKTMLQHLAQLNEQEKEEQEKETKAAENQPLPPIMIRNVIHEETFKKPAPKRVRFRE